LSRYIATKDPEFLNDYLDGKNDSDKLASSMEELIKHTSVESRPKYKELDAKANKAFDEFYKYGDNILKLADSGTDAHHIAEYMKTVGNPIVENLNSSTNNLLKLIQEREQSRLAEMKSRWKPRFRS
jgi:CHASE3 domain sensor protein